MKIPLLTVDRKTKMKIMRQKLADRIRPNEDEQLLSIISQRGDEETGLTKR